MKDLFVLGFFFFEKNLFVLVMVAERAEHTNWSSTHWRRAEKEAAAAAGIWAAAGNGEIEQAQRESRGGLRLRRQTESRGGSWTREKPNLMTGPVDLHAKHLRKRPI